MSESDLIALALSPNGDGANGAQKLVSLPSDSTLNSVSLTEVDGTYKLAKYTLCIIITRLCHLYLYLGKEVLRIILYHRLTADGPVISEQNSRCLS